MADYTLELRGETLILMPERAVFWPRTQTLFIADPHFGKAATFRAYTIPLPEGNMRSDLDRLSQALDSTQADHLIILGDLLHSKRGRDNAIMDEFAQWRAARGNLKITLIIGNHDRRAGDLPAEWDIRVVEGPTPGPNFVLCHEPIVPADGYALAGHLHPAASLGTGKQRLKLPCFWFGKHCAVLPAFASFTDGKIVQTLPSDQVFLITERHVIPKLSRA